MTSNAVSDTIVVLSKQDWTTLTKLIHPQRGVCITPYPEACTKSLTANELSNLIKSSEKRTWGQFDGSGEPMNLTWTAYYKQFIYDRDFANAPEVVKNEYMIRGSSVFDLKKHFPNAKLVEYHFPNSDPLKNDWASLRLVFESYEGKDYLIAIQHDSWTT
jgi:hypothetical protein